MPKVVCIVGYHNSGKTSLIERLIQELQRRGYKVGYIKHDPKGHGMTDKEGSDTDRIFKLSERVALMSPQKLTLWERREDDPLKVVEEYFSDCHPSVFSWVFFAMINLAFSYKDPYGMAWLWELGPLRKNYVCAFNVDRQNWPLALYGQKTHT